MDGPVCGYNGDAQNIELIEAGGLRAVLTLIGVGLGIAGLYAVTAHAVGQRRRELAIRIALGALAMHVGRSVLIRACWQVALGLLAGISSLDLAMESPSTDDAGRASK